MHHEGERVMKAKRIGYWVTLALFCLAMAGGGFADLTQNAAIMESMTRLGFPSYVATILGFWKIAGVVALLLPGFGRLKEWAYAGFFFDLTGATAAHLFVKDAMPEPIVPLIILAIGMASWYLRPASRCIGQMSIAAAVDMTMHSVSDS
ncbi:MAG: DoxX family protein [Rhodopirellula baltica]